MNEIQERSYNAVIVADISLIRNLLDLEKVKSVLASSDTRLYIEGTEISLTSNNDKRLEKIKILFQELSI